MVSVRILIAEDHEIMRRGLRSLLATRPDWELCGEAADGREAVEKAKHLKPDVIVLDVSMPLLNGLDAARIIRREVPETEILILSQYDPAEMKAKALEAGARAYVSKSEVARELLKELDAVVNHQRRFKSTTETKTAEPQAASAIASRDATAKSYVEEPLLERARLRELFIQSPVPIGILSGPNHRIVFLNDAAVRAMGRTCAQDLLGKTSLEAFPEAEGQGYFELLDQVYGTGVPFSATEMKITLNRQATQQPTEAYFNFIYQPIRNWSGVVEGILVHGVEVTPQVVARDQLEERVKERTAELERMQASLCALTGRLLQVQDDERRRIARELHDSTGQALAALSIDLSIIEMEAEKLSLEASKAVTQCLELVREMSKELRTISYLLYPPLLDEAGLPSAIRWYLEGFAERSGIQVELDLAPPDLARLSREHETTVFRIVQECLNNIHRHSGSLTAAIRVTLDAHELRLEVRDYGKGMPEANAAGASGAVKTGVGIQGMRERVRQLGGRLEIHSAGNGTTVRAVLPVSSAAISSAGQRAGGVV